MEHLPLGLGTYDLTDPETCRGAVEHAIETGYRHVDIAGPRPASRGT